MHDSFIQMYVSNLVCTSIIYGLLYQILQNTQNMILYKNTGTNNLLPVTDNIFKMFFLTIKMNVKNRTKIVKIPKHSHFNKVKAAHVCFITYIMHIYELE